MKRKKHCNAELETKIIVNYVLVSRQKSKGGGGAREPIIGSSINMSPTKPMFVHYIFVH